MDSSNSNSVSDLSSSEREDMQIYTIVQIKRNEREPSDDLYTTQYTTAPETNCQRGLYHCRIIALILFVTIVTMGVLISIGILAHSPLTNTTSTTSGQSADKQKFSTQPETSQLRNPIFREIEVDDHRSSIWFFPHERLILGRVKFEEEEKCILQPYYSSATFYNRISQDLVSHPEIVSPDDKRKFLNTFKSTDVEIEYKEFLPSAVLTGCDGIKIFWVTR